METIKNFLKKNYGNGAGEGSGHGDTYYKSYSSGCDYHYGFGSCSNNDSNLDPDSDYNVYDYHYGAGLGFGSGSGYGYDNRSGIGAGNGSGIGTGIGTGNGTGYSDNDNLKSLNNQPIHVIDGIQTIITSVRGDNVAKGFIVNEDLTLTPCFITKSNNFFAHGETLEKSFKALDYKIFNNLSDDERIDNFISKFPDLNKKVKAIDLFEWHNLLTASCEMGRIQFCKDNEIDINLDSFSIAEFISLTENSYGKEIILKLKSKINNK